jgi:hypothetical protein
VPEDLTNNDLDQFEQTPMQSVEYVVKHFGLTTKHCQPLEQKFIKNLVRTKIFELNFIKMNIEL